jgi:hypothetical protein
LFLAAAILPWRTAHDPLEGCAESAFGFVAERKGNDGNGIAGIHQPVPGQQHSPARQVFHGWRPNRLFEFQRKGRSRHAGTLSQFLQSPVMRRIVVHGVDRRAHPLICQGEEPPNATSQPFRQVQTQGLNQHHVGEVLYDQKAARLPLAQLLHHPLHGPAQRSLVRFFPDMHDGRQHPQQDAGMIGGKGEAATDKKEISAAIA